MANLAIKGHATRGKEVIEILKMLGGKNKYSHFGETESYAFYIIDGIIDCDEVRYLNDYIIYTLEEFLEKFPYKIGDKAFAFDNKCTIIDAVWDEGIYEVVYTIKLDTSKYTTTKLSNQLQPYKEETMEKIIKIDMPKGYEFAGVDNQQVVFEKVKSKYPKTYRECAEIVEFNIEEEPTIFGYKEELLDRFQKLLICRDAYWKLAGDWRPNVEDEKQDKYAISNVGGKMSPEYYGSYNSILCFPTREIRDIFFETFKDVIEKCKELL